MIEIIDVPKFIKINQIDGPVLSPQFYFGNSDNFHPNGLYSETIFGTSGSPERKNKLSYINLNCKVINGLLYDILRKRIFRKIDILISGEKTFSLDPDGYLIEDENGDISGMSKFVENIHKIRFSPNDDGEEGDRNKIIEMIYENIKNDTFFMDKLLVTSPEFRPLTVMEDTGETHIDELSKLYQKILISANTLGNISGPIRDSLNFRMQQLIKDLYELIKIKVAKKGGIIRNLILGKRIDFSARSVITPNPEIQLGYVGIPLRIIVEIFEPFIIHEIINSEFSSNIPLEFHKAVKEFLDKESLLAD